MSTTTEDVIRAAASVGRDAAEGRLDPAELDQAVADECRQLVGQVVGPEDPLFALQCEIARGVLAVGGIGAEELSEWAAVQRRRDQPAEAVAPSETSAVPGGDDSLLGVVSSASGPHSPGNPTAADEPGAAPKTNRMSD